MKYEYKDYTNRQARDKTLEMVFELPFYVQTFITGREANMSARTQFIYISRINKFYEYLAEHKFKGKKKEDITLDDLGTLSVEDIEAFTSFVRHGHFSENKRDNKESTINSYLSALSVFFKYFVSRGKLKFNPAEGIERGRAEKHNVIRLDESQKKDFFKCIETGDTLTKQQKNYHDKNSLRDMAICMTLVRTGLRVSELVGLNVDDINFDNCSFSVLRKGNKYDSVFFDDSTAELLKEYLEYRKELCEGTKENAVFVVTFGKYKGTRLSVRSVERMVKKYSVYGSTAGSAISPHKLRATYATDMLKATNNISLVQKALNHESPTTTMVYADQRIIDLEKARNTLDKKTRTKN